jgi:TonB family protein
MRTRFAILALASALSSAVFFQPSAFSQDSNPDAVQRKAIAKVAPKYPPLARQMKLSGKVKLEAVVAPDGHVKSTRTIGGSPLLVNAALDAIHMWKYEPSPKETVEIIEIDFKSPDQ